MEPILNKHISAWKEYLTAAIRASESGDQAGMDRYMELAQAEYEEYKQEMNADYPMGECLNYGFATYIVEDNAYDLFRDKDRAPVLKEFVSIVRSDGNLKAEQALIQSLKEGTDLKDDGELRTYVNECISLAEGMADKDTVRDSNRKLTDFINRNRLVASKDADDNIYRIYESVDYIMTHKRKIDDLKERARRVNSIVESLMNIRDGKEAVCEAVETGNPVVDFLNRCKASLTEDERRFVSDFLASPEKRKEIFEDYRNECRESIGSMLDECMDDEHRKELSKVMESVNSLSYDEDNIIETVSKLLDIRQVLAD